MKRLAAVILKTTIDDAKITKTWQTHTAVADAAAPFAITDMS